jgi:hypothetical protein
MANAGLVLNRDDGSIRPDLDGIRSSGQAQAFRPQRDAPEDEAPALPFVVRAVDTAVGPGASGGGGVVNPGTVDMDQRALPTAVRVVLDR